MVITLHLNACYVFLKKNSSLLRLLLGIMMSGTEMNDVQKLIPTFKICEPKKHINGSHIVGLFKVVQSLHKDKVFCDIRIETNDGTMLFGHKVVLGSASPYFCAMFTSFEGSSNDLVHITELDSTALQLLVNYIYTGEITVTEENVQLDYVKNVCTEFIQTQLDPSNCLGIKAFAILHNCTELLLSSEAYIKKQFLKVVKCDEFLSLSSVEVIKLISCNDLFVPLEEKVFECVTNWVEHELDNRKIFFSELMEHVRLPLISKQYILEKVVDEPLIKNSPKCKDYVFEAFHVNLLKSVQPFTKPLTVRSKPRQFDILQKVILVLSWSTNTKKTSTNWYDPANNLWHNVLEMKMKYCRPAHLALIADQFVFAVGNNRETKSQSVSMLDLTSQAPCWVQTADMLIGRSHLAVGVLYNSVYAVGGFDGSSDLKSAEVFRISIQKWKMVASMARKRQQFGIGVLNNKLYAVGGYDSSSKNSLKSVECYYPVLDSWKFIKDMSIGRSNAGIAVLDGVMYAIGGISALGTVQKSVEAYTTNPSGWTPRADMHLCRYSPGVIALDGLLYVVGGMDNDSTLDSIETYNPITNEWKLMESSINDDGQIFTGVVIDKPPHFNTD
eukprot:XP_016656115.1 PREDICTED: kelch-like protein 2 isoform X2 [Acyrthosiphon pisum]